MKKLQECIVNLCRKHPYIYTACYLGSLILSLVIGALFPFAAKSIVYPVFCEQSEETGVIEEIIERKVKLPMGRSRSGTYSKYSFLVDGLQVNVTPDDYRSYEQGELYSYILYQRGGKGIGEWREYKLWQGLAALIPIIGVWFAAALFICTETSEAELSKRAHYENAAGNGSSKGIRFEEYTTGELYELCLSRGIKVMGGKRKNRRYLMNCLMRQQEEEADICKLRKKEKKFEKIMLPVWVLCLIWELSIYMRHAYYIFYGFFK